MSPHVDLGLVHTRGTSFRARAEQRQREYRATVLGSPWAEHGHWLAEGPAGAGANFVVPEAFEAAKVRHAAGKGVGDRTFFNMLASQAMCFNIFAPLANDLALAAAALVPFFPGLGTVTRIEFEYTPSNDVFGDQSGQGGVDCDLLVSGVWSDGMTGVIAIETKFVEPEFSRCGFRKPGRAKQGKAVCPTDVALDETCSSCLYSSRKKYRYWERTWEVGNIRRDAIPTTGCPFAGDQWQLWVNNTLAHVEAKRRGAQHAFSAVCAPAANDVLLDRGEVLSQFRRVASTPDAVVFIPVDDLIQGLARLAGRMGAAKGQWIAGLQGRYAGI